MKICDEMVKLRNALDEKGVQWEDKSTIYPENKIQEIMSRCNVSRKYADASMWRTHFTYKGYFFSVIYGYGSYGYYDNKLECMIGGEEPEGGMTAEDVLKRMEELYDR